MKEKMKKFWQKVKPAVNTVGKLLIVISTFILITCVVGSVWRSCKLRAKADNIKSVSSSLFEDILPTYDGSYSFNLPVGYTVGMTTTPKAQTDLNIPNNTPATVIINDIPMSFPLNMGFNTAYMIVPYYNVDFSSFKVDYSTRRIDFGNIQINTPYNFSGRTFYFAKPFYNTDYVSSDGGFLSDNNGSIGVLCPFNIDITFSKYNAFNGVKSYLYNFQQSVVSENQVPIFTLSITCTFYNVPTAYYNRSDDNVLTSFVVKISIPYDVYFVQFYEPYCSYFTANNVGDLIGDTYISYINPSETYENGYNSGYNQGYTEGKQQGNTDGYNSGYNKGYSDGRTAPEYSFTEFFTGFGQSFISIWDGITNHTFLGINIGGLIGVTLMISIVAIVVKKIGK